MQFLEASNTVEILRAAGPGGLHVDEIARRIGELNGGGDPVDPGKLSEWPTPMVGIAADGVTPCAGHILRLLATYHWLREVRPDVFANNRLSALVDSGKTPEQLRDACVLGSSHRMRPN